MSYFLDNNETAPTTTTTTTSAGEEILSYHMMEGDDTPLPWIDVAVGETRAEIETLQLTESAQWTTTTTMSGDSTASLNTNNEVSLHTFNTARSTIASTMNTGDFPTDAALQLLQLQVDPEASSHVFRMTPPPLLALNSADSSTNAANLAGDDPTVLTQGMDGMLDYDFSSVFKHLAAGAGAPVVDHGDDNHNVAAILPGMMFHTKEPFDTPLASNKTTSGTSSGSGITNVVHSSWNVKPKAMNSSTTTSSVTRGPVDLRASNDKSNTSKHLQKSSKQLPVATFTPKNDHPARPSVLRSLSQSKTTSTTGTGGWVQAEPTMMEESSSPAATTKERRSKSIPKKASTRKRPADPHSSEMKRPIKKLSIKKKKETEKKKKNDEDDGGAAPTPPGIETVGPSSKQMQVVNHMIAYMRQTYTDQKMLDEILEMVDYCMERHLKNEVTFKHLPGAILDHTLEIISPDEFLRIFQMFRPSSSNSSSSSASQQQQQASRTVAAPDRSPTSGPQANAASAASATEPTPNVLVIGPPPPPAMAVRVPDYLPNLIEAAVGYGFHLARLHDPNNRNKEVNLHKFLTKGAATVLSMSSEERCLFWKYLMDPSTVFHHHHVHPPNSE